MKANQESETLVNENQTPLGESLESPRPALYEAEARQVVVDIYGEDFDGSDLGLYSGIAALARSAYAAALTARQEPAQTASILVDVLNDAGVVVLCGNWNDPKVQEMYESGYSVRKSQTTGESDFCYAPGDEGAKFCGDPKARHHTDAEVQRFTSCSVKEQTAHLIPCMRDDHLIHHTFVAVSEGETNA